MFHFIKHRKIWYIISLLVILPCLGSLITRGLNLGIDFTGGNLIEFKMGPDVTIQQVRETVDQLGYGSSRIQQSGNDTYLIRTVELEEEESAKLVSNLQTKLHDVQLLRNERVGPVIGKELTMKAIMALLIASVLMLIYITFRFEFKQGIAAIIALLHDILVVIGVFSLFQIEIDSAFVAAILTIIGYSINDTIIIFDRIRENMKTRKKGETLEDLANISLWQTLARSINTVLTVMFVLLALYFIGGITIKTFVLAMIIGVSSGAYSSMFNASPVWVDLKLMEKAKR
ncbi:preprotein translocase subunit SecF [Desulfotomaculum arcticum]|uniref:Protein-export membrane protein SecF n=1 Tax=Desulfotruncus arcticus DSM 17038 TaxID=1121424 RepID=A0A1I2SE68_9FIRM|nr:protein translocase subunit SecF [Desulfotruncus arcticus]SFG51010.1 preprotein translocase subunit SecF [Desulfotomaculum arcticum] [Desulfotruncus arcticus DSM 17038]